MEYIIMTNRNKNEYSNNVIHVKKKKKFRKLGTHVTENIINVISKENNNNNTFYGSILQ